MVFAVFRQGVYRHECGGVFSDEARARACADKLAAADLDGYHEYEVIPFLLDEHSPLGEPPRFHYGSPQIVERRWVYTTSKANPHP